MPFVGVTLLMLAAAVNADIGISAETRAGHAPITAGGAAQSAAISAITPSAGAETSTHALSLRLQYAPRLSWVFSHQTDSNTYVLHQGALSLQWRPQAGATWTARAAAETGETDYAALTQLLGRNQPAIPVVKGFTMFQGGITGSHDLVRAWRFELSADVIRRIPLLSTTQATDANPVPPVVVDPTGPPPAVGTPPAMTDLNATRVYRFPNQTSLSATPGISHPISRRDAFVLRTAVAYGALSTGLRLLNVGPEFGWRRTIDAETTFHAEAGIVHANRLHPDTNVSTVYGGTTPTSATSPVGGLGIASRLYGARGIKVMSGFNAAVAYYLDPVLGVSGSQGTSGLQLGVELPPRWIIALETAFSTSLRSHPLPGLPDETLLVASLPFRCRLNQNFSFEFGGRAAARGPHLEATSFAFRRPEFWAYLMLGATFGTRRGG